jgi:hypothetical protein
VKEADPCRLLQELSDGFDGKDEEQRRKRAPLSKPLPCAIGEPTMPFRSTREVAVEKRAANQFQNRGGKPLLCKRSRINSHLTESKALRMSSLKRRAGIFALLNLMAMFLT